MIDFPASPEEREPSSTATMFNGVQLSSRIIPAASGSAGGDWCEALILSEDVVALSIGDVCGHGHEKFAAMVAIRQAIRAFARAGFDPAHILTRANTALQTCNPNETATAIFALLDTRKRTVSFANAGHPAPLMVGPLGAVFLEFPARDVPLGVDTDYVPMLRTINMPAASLLVLYTDGVTDRERLTSEGEAQLRLAARAAHRSADRPAADTIDEHLSLSGCNRDDAAILTARSHATPIERNVFARSQRYARAEPCGGAT